MKSSSKSNPATTCIIFFLLLSCTSSSPIKTVVILVMENRSFDHMLGWMKKLNPDINGVTGSESNPLSTSDPSSPLLFFSNLSSFLSSDPPHSFSSINSQLFSPLSSPLPTMNGFAQQACSLDCTLLPQQVMSGFDPHLLPVYSSLLSNFAIFDRWFSSAPASTQPNRLFLHSATSHGATSNDPALLALGYPQSTIFDSLEKDGVSFGIYYQNIPATLFYKSLRKLKFLTTRFWGYASYFRKHAMEGRLPSYVVIEQRYIGSSSSPANDDHPSHDVGEGQRLVKEVYEVLRASPLWNQTLFIVTYDEHGGFFDHVPVPTVGVPSPDDVLGPSPFRFKFDRLGVRVPTIMVSPWIEKGTVVHKPKGAPFANSEYEHSSIPATIKKIFNLSSPFLTRRDAWAGTFESILQTRKEPRTDCPVKLPEPIKLGGQMKDDKEVSEFQNELIDLARVLKGENVFNEEKMKMKKKMSVKEGKEYVEDAVKRYIHAGKLAIQMGAHPDRVLQMRSSLSTPPNRSP